MFLISDLSLQKIIGILSFGISLIIIMIIVSTLRDKQCKIDKVECNNQNQDLVFTKTGKIMLYIFLSILIIGVLLLTLPDFAKEI
jgi:hypothetical protein